MSLPKKHAAFVREYLLDLNGTKACERAGYSKKAAASQSTRLLKNAKIQEALSDGMKKRAEKCDITAERILKELAAICFADISKAYDEQNQALPFHKMPEDVRRAISAVDVEELFGYDGRDKVQIGVTKKLRFWDKGRAAELIFKHLGLIAPTKVEHTGKDGAPLHPPTALAGLTTEELAGLEAMLASSRKAG